VKTRNSFGARSQGNFWVVTSYYNPCGYRSRRTNYDHFRSALTAPLLTVELARPGHFELQDGGADLLVRVESEDVMWHKERLLNLALEHLPPECTELAWVDCDVIFESEAWIEEASRALEKYPLVQCFTQMDNLPPDFALSTPLSAQVTSSRPSLGARRQRGEDVFTAGEASFAAAVRYGVAWSCAAGVAWCTHRDTLAAVGLYDTMIVGGGDGALAHAALGEQDRAVRLFRLGPAHREHYLRWAARFHDAVRAGVGVIDGTVYHLWHGEVRDRQYNLRHAILRKFSFDPSADLAVAPAGCWCWSSDKPSLHQAVEAFFSERREDGRS
jgi:hypothetical protein